jgi:hypothetical protein
MSVSSEDGPEIMATQDPPDRGSRDPDPQLAQLSLDAHASPRPVLPTEANDEFHELTAHWRPARTALCSPPTPFPPGQLALPPEQGVGGDEETPPSGPRQQAAQRGEDRSIGWPVPDTSVDLPFEDPELVPQHHDLDILVRFGPLSLRSRQIAR